MTNFNFNQEQLPNNNDNETSNGSIETLYTKICSKILSFSKKDPELDEIYEELSELKQFTDQNTNIFYSAITTYVYGLNEEFVGTYFINLEKIYNKVIENEQDEEIKRKLHKIYDHSKLAYSQRKYTCDTISSYEKKIKDLDKRIDKANSSIDSVTKNYIAILGIFTSIVFTFFGGFNFITSIFQNISNTSFFKLLALSLILGLILYSLLILLYNFIFKILEKNISLLERIHYICIVVTIILALLALAIAFYFEKKASSQLYELLITNGIIKL